MRIKTVTAKLATMRKPQEFVVYPFTPESTGSITVQSDKAIGQFDPITGQGMLNSKGSSSKYFVHLMPQLGAVPYTFPREFVDECIASQPQSGDSIGPNGTVRIA